MPSHHNRIRLERLICGPFETSDLTRLFLALRMDAETETVREIGHFVAHSDEREQGLTTNIARDFFVVIKFVLLNLIKTPQRPVLFIDPRKLDPLFIPYARINFENLSKRLIFKETGLKQKQAIATLESMIGKFEPTQQGCLTLKQPLNDSEVNLFRCLVSHYVITYAFDEVRLFNEFCHDLQAQGLLRSDEKELLRAKAPSISLFAITAMHGCNIIISDDFNARLSIGLVDKDQLCVTATVHCPTANIPTLRMATAMFKTSLPRTLWCDKALAEAIAANPSRTPNSERVIELSSDQRLREIILKGVSPDESKTQPI
jgi:hypothetical protein